MTVYIVKQLRNKHEHRALVSERCVYGCPDVDPQSPMLFADGGHHSRARHAGEEFTETVSVESDVIERDESGTYIRKVTIMRQGKVSDKCLPTCRCGEEFVRLGYHFKLTNEDHSEKAYGAGGFIRNGSHDVTLEDRFFKTRKAARRHLEAVAKR